ncbi:Hypothetical predicted protein, partial [Pelobates cultripes]
VTAKAHTDMVDQIIRKLIFAEDAAVTALQLIISCLAEAAELYGLEEPEEDTSPQPHEDYHHPHITSGKSEPVVNQTVLGFSYLACIFSSDMKIDRDRLQTGKFKQSNWQTV